MSNVNEPNNPGVLVAESDSELAEVLIERDDDLSIAHRMGEDFLVARVGAPVAHPLDLVSRTFDLTLRAGPDAAIEQDFQAALSAMRGSTRSCPTTRRAYARQASTSSRSSHG